DGSFKSWLLNLTAWRIGDQFRKRQRDIQPARWKDDTATGTDTIERIRDPAGEKLETIWDSEWERNLMDAAIERVKQKVDAKQFQIFDLYVLKKWPVAKVAGMLKINVCRVYLAKHRVGTLIKREISTLRVKPI